RSQLRDSFVVGSIATADRNRPSIQPHHVAAFETPGRGNRTKNGVSQRAQRGFLRGRLSLSRRLSHATEDRAAIADDRSVSDIDGIQAGWVIVRKEVQFDSVMGQGL